MDRRQFISVTAAGAVASVVATTTLVAQETKKMAFVLVHGSWHGAWCWGLVEPHLNNQGFMSVAIDLPGHGLSANNPKSFNQRPLDPAAFGTEPSPIASIGIDAFADAVVAGVDRAIAAGAEKVVLVAHSMGGVPATFAATKASEKIDGIIYLAALAPVPGKPAGAYLGLEDQHNNSKIGPIVLADPEKIGALRVDPRSTDAAYLANFKTALAADVDDELLASVMHLLTPDAPVAMYGEVANFPADFAKIKKTYIRCSNDQTVVPSTPEAIVADMDAAWPTSKTKLVDLASSHEAMFSQPKALAQMLMEHA